MVKFRCQRCGQRIAVPKSHLNRLVTCAECGARTHPLAEQIVSASGPNSPEDSSATQTAAPAAPQAACDNCGAAIGRLQSTHAWQGHVVCGACFPRLLGDSGTLPTEPAPPLAASRTITRMPREPASLYDVHDARPLKPFALELRERVLRGLVVFRVASVALYGALTLLRDVAGLVAVAAVAVLALLAMYALLRGALAARRRAGRGALAGPAAYGAGGPPGGGP